MHLKCSGLSGGVNVHDFDAPVVRADLFEDGDWEHDSNCRDEEGNLRIRWTALSVRMSGGNYKFVFTLTRDEIANLFVASFRDRSLDEVVSVISRVSLLHAEKTQAPTT